MSTVRVSWRARPVPLPACGVVGRREAARALARRLAGWENDRLAAVRSCAGGGALVVLGEELVLPWADGAIYLGRDPDAPQLLLPTHSTPDVPVGLFAAALAARVPAGAWAVLPGDGGLCVVGVGAATRVTRAGLEAWLEAPS